MYVWSSTRCWGVGGVDFRAEQEILFRRRSSAGSDAIALLGAESGLFSDEDCGGTA